MNNIESVHAAFNAAEAGDLERFRNCFSDDAIIWHNFDFKDQPIDEAIEQLREMTKAFTRLEYKERRYIEIPEGIVAQHVSHSALADGNVLIVPIMQRIILSEGLITRIEEYLDTSAMSKIFGT